ISCCATFHCCMCRRKHSLQEDNHYQSGRTGEEPARTGRRFTRRSQLAWPKQERPHFSVGPARLVQDKGRRDLLDIPTAGGRLGRSTSCDCDCGTARDTREGIRNNISVCRRRPCRRRERRRGRGTCILWWPLLEM